MFKSLFHLPQILLFLTEEEKDFVHKTFGNEHIPNEVVGLGIDIPQRYLSEEEFRQRFNIDGPFIVYVGRIDESKGCRELIDYFIKYKKKDKDIKLVLVGKSVMDVPVDPSIISLGFVTEEEKFGAIASSELLVMPSKFESFSIALLEGMYLKKPVLVNGQCDVLVGHCRRGNSGLYYENYSEFEYCMKLLTENKVLSASLGERGYKYITDNYQWGSVIEKISNAIES